MDAVITAGGFAQPGDPLFPFTDNKPKALLEVCGKPMIQWVIDALDRAQSIERVVIAGMEPAEGIRGEKLQRFIPNQGSMIGNIRAGTRKLLEQNPDIKHIVIASSDIPAVMPEQIDWVVQTALETDEDLYYNIVTREVMEKKFPLSHRSYVHLKDMEVCGGDLNILRASIVSHDDELWKKIIDARKNALKQAALIGFDSLFLLLLRQLTLEDAIKRVTTRLGLTGRALVCPYAEIAMDVDKPHQLEIMRAELRQRLDPA